MALLTARRKWLLIVGVLVTLGTAMVAFGGRGHHGADSIDALAPPSRYSWHDLAAVPLDPLQGMRSAWTGSEAIFFGGVTNGYCPEGADCTWEPGRGINGAAYDPATGHWRVIAPLPEPVVEAPETSPVAAGRGRVVAAGVSGSVYMYDAGTDTWTSLASASFDWVSSLTLDGDRVYRLMDRSDAVEMFDLAAEPGWRALPPPPQPITSQARLLVTDAGPALVDPHQDKTDVWIYDGTTWRDLGQGAAYGYGWYSTGSRLIEPTLTGRSSKERAVLDVAAGTWSALEKMPLPPADRDGAFETHAGAGPLMTTTGWVYDDRDGSWTELPPPPDGYDLGAAALWTPDGLMVVGGAAHGGSDPGTNAARVFGP